MQVLEMLRSRIAQRVMGADQTLTTAANRLAANENVDHGAIENALIETGRTVDDFDALCVLARRRREWRAILDKGPAAKTRLDKAQATAARERAEFERVQSEWFARAAEIETDIAAAERVTSAVSAARAELVNPRNVYGAAGKQLAAAHEAVEAATARVAAINRELPQLRELEKSQREWAAHKKELNASTVGGDAESHTVRADRAARQIKELQTELKTATADETAALEQLQALEAAALKI